MSDIAVSLIVILCTGALIALLFIAVSRRRKKKDRELAEYCQSHGYAFHKEKGPLCVEIRIEGDTFGLVSRMASQRHEAETGSDSWKRETVFTAHAANSGRPYFALGSVPAAGNWEAMPDWMKSAAVSKLMSESGMTFTGRPQFIHANGAAGFLLFEQTPGDSRSTLQRLEPLLHDWPAQHHLLIYSQPAQIRILLPDYFIHDTATLDRVLSLGHACMG